ncbi:MAG: glucose-1-phosphate adenylyltransferase [Sarcina sp.]
MKHNKEIISMILAGGKGTRLGVLTESIAKPAIPYGGKYRLIDFPLSNCANSGIDTVGVVTQYKPNAIYNHIGNGEYWNLKKIDKYGVSFLPPYRDKDKESYYTGTANAIYQNIRYIDNYNPKYILILSGDHIYKMNYADMLSHHKMMNAVATIATIEVPMEEASRFGIMNLNADTTIDSFDEKPEIPRSNTASMGIYIFNWQVLRGYLINDEKKLKSSHDFGKDIIPAMLEAEERMVGYRFKGYWKDVGTVESLWSSNMDLLDHKCELSLNDKWKIASKSDGYEKHKVGFDAVIKNSILGENCEIDGYVQKSVISKNVKIGKGAFVKNSVILANAVIEKHAHVENAIIGEYAVVREDAEVIKNGGVAVVGSHKEIAKDSDNIA